MRLADWGWTSFSINALFFDGLGQKIDACWGSAFKGIADVIYNIFSFSVYGMENAESGDNQVFVLLSIDVKVTVCRIHPKEWFYEFSNSLSSADEVIAISKTTFYSINCLAICC